MVWLLANQANKRRFLIDFDFSRKYSTAMLRCNKFAGERCYFLDNTPNPGYAAMQHKGHTIDPGRAPAMMPGGVKIDTQ